MLGFTWSRLLLGVAVAVLGLSIGIGPVSRADDRAAPLAPTGAAIRMRDADPIVLLGIGGPPSPDFAGRSFSTDAELSTSDAVRHAGTAVVKRQARRGVWRAKVRIDDPDTAARGTILIDLDGSEGKPVGALKVRKFRYGPARLSATLQAESLSCAVPATTSYSARWTAPGETAVVVHTDGSRLLATRTDAAWTDPSGRTWTIVRGGDGLPAALVSGGDIVTFGGWTDSSVNVGWIAANGSTGSATGVAVDAERIARARDAAAQLNLRLDGSALLDGFADFVHAAATAADVVACAISLATPSPLTFLACGPLVLELVNDHLVQDENADLALTATGLLRIAADCPGLASCALSVADAMLSTARTARDALQDRAAEIAVVSWNAAVGDARILASSLDPSRTQSRIYRVDPRADGTDVLVGTVRDEWGYSLGLYDVAASSSGALYGTDADSLWRINATTGAATYVGYLGYLVNGLAFAAEGTLYGSTEDGWLARIDPSTAAVTWIGSFGGGLRTAGDLAFSADGTLHALTETSPTATSLSRIDIATGRAAKLRDLPGLSPWGLSRVGGSLVIFASDDPACGGAGGIWLVHDTLQDPTKIRCLTFDAGGAQ